MKKIKASQIRYIKAEWEYLSNSTVDDRNRRFDLWCSFCPPNKGENATKKPKHGKKKKYKLKRKGRV